MRTYRRKHYRALSDGNIFDNAKGAAASYAGNLVKGAANSAVNGINKATGGIKIPPVSVGITKETKSMIYKVVGGLGAAAVVTALIIKNK